MKKNIFTITFGILLVISCKKEKGPEPSAPTPDIVTHYNYLDESITPYKFKAGTYWVYENDSTAALDSIVVDSVSTGLIITTPSMHGTTDETKSEFYMMYMHDVTNSVYYNQTLLNKVIMQNFGGDYFGFDGQPTYSSNSPVGATTRGMTITAKSLSMTLNSTTYNNVDQAQIIAANQYQTEFTYDTYLYYADTVGLIKKEFSLPTSEIESWSLKRWQIIR